MSSTIQQAGIKRIDLQRHDPGVPVGGGNAAELATYVVEKGKPFLVVVEE